eukprot:CAMPEP_0119476572 /NCGR_PEP_ID=MMETSP1344-20130328/7039_1 /TAXON_ID=236787 /ORGANISM="Florenciella parvula, Strain CCMP2471" /LENGTH=52 /DNA_ID=CAMNT_0007510357 /DNA_START=136 /DNA_END=291 /DNA_ORIENTATION=+
MATTTPPWGTVAESPGHDPAPLQPHPPQALLGAKFKIAMGSCMKNKWAKKDG